MPRDESGKSPPFVIRLRLQNDRELSLRYPEEEQTPSKRQCKLQPGAQVPVDVEFKQQKKVAGVSLLYSSAGATVGRRLLVSNVRRFQCSTTTCRSVFSEVRLWLFGGETCSRV